MSLSPEAVAAHQAWKAALEAARWTRMTNPVPFITDENRGRWSDLQAACHAKWGVADDAVREAFKVMTEALPAAGERTNFTVQEWVAKRDTLVQEYGAVKVWSNAAHWNGHYPAIAEYAVDTVTGERFLVMTQMFDDCVDEAARLNALVALYQEAKRTGDYSAYYQRAKPMAAA